MTIDQMITEAEAASLSLRWAAHRSDNRPRVFVTDVGWPAAALSSRPRRRRHRATPIEYRLSQTDVIVAGTALALLVAALSFPLAYILFGTLR